VLATFRGRQTQAAPTRHRARVSKRQRESSAPRERQRPQVHLGEPTEPLGCPTRSSLVRNGGNRFAAPSALVHVLVTENPLSAANSRILWSQLPDLNWRPRFTKTRKPATTITAKHFFPVFSASWLKPEGPRRWHCTDRKNTLWHGLVGNMVETAAPPRLLAIASRRKDHPCSERKSRLGSMASGLSECDDITARRPVTCRSELHARGQAVQGLRRTPSALLTLSGLRFSFAANRAAAPGSETRASAGRRS